MEWLGYTVLGIVLSVVVAVMVLMRRPPLVIVARVLSLIAGMVFFAWTISDAFGFVWATFMLGWLMMRLWSRRRARAEPPAVVSPERQDWRPSRRHPTTFRRLAQSPSTTAHRATTSPDS